MIHSLRTRVLEAVTPNCILNVRSYCPIQVGTVISVLDHWYSMFPADDFGYLSRHIRFAEKNDFNDIIKFDLPAVEIKLDQHLMDFQKLLPDSKTQPYIAEERIAELSDIESTKFATSKLIRLLREINIAYNNDAHLSVGILVRAIIDHIPPVFGYSTFPEVANNYKGTKSFKNSMQRLNDSLRNLADSYLHVQIRKIESLPTAVQVDFRAEIDAVNHHSIISTNQHPKVSSRFEETRFFR